MIVLIPQRRGSLEPSPRGPFGLRALFLFMLFLDLFAFPLGTRATYCVVGGGWVGGAYFGVFSKRRIILLEVGRILISKISFHPGFNPGPTASKTIVLPTIPLWQRLFLTL